MKYTDQSHKERLGLSIYSWPNYKRRDFVIGLVRLRHYDTTTE